MTRQEFDSIAFLLIVTDIAFAHYQDTFDGRSDEFRRLTIENRYANFPFQAHSVSREIDLLQFTFFLPKCLN